MFVLFSLLLDCAGEDVVGSDEVDSFACSHCRWVYSRHKCSVRSAEGHAPWLECRSVRAPEGWSTLAIHCVQHSKPVSICFGDSQISVIRKRCFGVCSRFSAAAAQRCSTLSSLLEQQNQEASQLLKVSSMNQSADAECNTWLRGGQK